MNDATLKTIVIDGLAAYLGADGKTAAQIASEIRVANVGDGFTESDLRSRVRSLIGATPDAIAPFLDSLVGATGTENTFTKSGSLYSVVADE